MFGFSTLAIAASLAAVVAANHGHGLHIRSHQHIRRAFSGQATYYQTGLGACGKYNSPSDKIVALNSAQYGSGYPGPQCWKMVRICKSGSDNCHNAQIVDQCPTCDYGSLDMSQSLFEQFASTDAGVFPITWTFVDGDGGDDKPTTSKKPTPTTTREPEPTTTWKPEPTTTWEPETTSTKKKTTSSPPPETTSTPEPTTSSTSSTPTTTSTTQATTSSASTSYEASLTAAATSAAPSASASSGSTSGSSSGSSSGSNLADANEIVLALGKLAVVANGGRV